MWPIYTFAGVYLTQNDNVLANNSAIFISDIGSADNILQCVTDRMSCCGHPNISGNWFYLDGNVVPSVIGRCSRATAFGRTRESGGTIINLHRVSDDVMMPTGQYCCVVPDATGVNQWACVVICKCSAFTLSSNNILNSFDSFWN